jgi:hypothetical protein
MNIHFKRILFTFFAACLISLNSKAQNIIEGYYGVKAGMNMTKISKLAITNSFKPGFHLGVFANFVLSEKFSIQHEALISLRGVSLELSQGAEYNKSFTYLDLPWMLNYHFSNNFYVSGGVQPSVYAYFKKPQPDSILYNKDNVTPIDFSYILGAAFLLDNNFGFGIRFCGGIVPAFDLNETKGKNHILQAYLMYAVNKKKRKGKR